MRLLAALTLQSPVVFSTPTIETLVKQLRADARFSKRAFTMEEYARWEMCTRMIWNVFLKDEHTSRPKDLPKPMLELIWRKTQGQRAINADLIEAKPKA
ncbi:MAG: hypothetical protein MZV70_75930 [Desulfobacterales bacterium]|nr:hypothetical protein [Desulfobacterales bacterium]